MKDFKQQANSRPKQFGERPGGGGFGGAGGAGGG